MPNPDRNRRTATSRGYDRQWYAASIEFKRHNPYCLGCFAVGKRVPTEVVDHVEPHKGDQLKFWNGALWQPACRWHHDVIKQQLERLYERGEATIKDLWLNSPMAIALTKKRPRRAAIGADGWVIGKGG